MSAHLDATYLRGASALERRFALYWATIPGAPTLVREHQFHPERRWRFDFVHHDSRVAIEIDGGVWQGTKGGHGGRGKMRDCEKDFEAAMLGWHVIRLTPNMIKNRIVLERLVEFVNRVAFGGVQ